MSALFDSSPLLAFGLAAGAIVIAPGPGQALVLTRTVQDGVRDGLLTALGLEIGTLLHTAAAAFGLSAILATSAAAFSVVEYLGAANLVFLGMAARRQAGRKPAPLETGEAARAFAVLGLLGDSTVALLGARARARLLRAPAWAAWRERVTGVVLVGLGLRLALRSRR